MTTAVILPPGAASYRSVAGLPLLRRIALSAQRAGFDRVIALGNGDEQRLREVLARDKRTRELPIANGNLAGLLQAERVALIPSDLLLNAATLQRVLAAPAGPEPMLFGAAGCADYGIVLCSREDALRLAPAIAGGGLSSATMASASLEPEICVRVRDETDVTAGERKLVEQLRQATADTDGPIARLDRALSTRISQRLVLTPLRPNHITTIGTCIGLFAGWCFAQGTYPLGVLGALLFWAAVIIDGCDGEVARLKFQETRYGGLYDVVTDNIVHVAIFAGIGLGYYRTHPDANFTLMVGGLVLGFLLCLLATVFCLLRHPPVKNLQPRSSRGRIRQALLRGFEALMNRDFAYLLVPLALFDCLSWFLWGAVFGTYGYAAGLVWIYRWRDAE